MIKQEIIEKISKYFKLTEYEAEKIYDEIFSIIITGVKEDNIVDVANFGEFIIKYNNEKTNGNGNGNGYKKTIEFLASSGFEEELNQRQIEEPKQVLREEIVTPTVTPAHDTFEGGSVEEELRRKREEILSKITGPILPRPVILTSQPEKPADIPEPEKTEVKEVPIEEPKTEEILDEVKTGTEEIKAAEDKIEEKTAEEEVDDISHRSFSDYFSEVTEEQKQEIEQKPFIEETKEDVIPKSAVLLHNEIMGSQGPGRIIPEEPLKQQIQPDLETVMESEHRAEDNSYYIWYKDSESNPTDTQTLSYEYELLYQATKEAEYKSKLKIYVTTFIIFFSVVLLLLIFSPLIYKFFFSPEEIQNIENTQEVSPNVSEQKGMPNVIQENITQQEQTQVAPPADTNSGKQTQVTGEQKTTQTEQQQVPPVKQEEKITKEPPSQVEKKIEGVTKSGTGWKDEKLNVLYVQLDNGKFTIQESSWDSDGKASKRISAVESLGIAGLKGSIVKADLGSKGTWFRVRFGEFSSLEEAHQKAEEYRNKERK